MDRVELGGLGQARNGFCIIILVILAFFLFAALVRAVKGPRIADRLVAVNMMGTMVMVIIATLSLVLDEEYLLDICLIYAMVSFLAVVVLSKVYIGIYEEKRRRDLPEGSAARENGPAEAGAAKEKEACADGDHGMD